MVVDAGGLRAVGLREQEVDQVGEDIVVRGRGHEQQRLAVPCVEELVGEQRAEDRLGRGVELLGAHRAFQHREHAARREELLEGQVDEAPLVTDLVVLGLLLPEHRHVVRRLGHRSAADGRRGQVDLQPHQDRSHPRPGGELGQCERWVPKGYR